MVKTENSLDGATVWFLRQADRKLAPGVVVDERVIGGKKMLMVLSASEPGKAATSLVDPEVLYRTPEDFIKEVESQDFAKAVEDLSKAYKEWGTEIDF